MLSGKCCGPNIGKYWPQLLTRGCGIWSSDTSRPKLASTASRAILSLLMMVKIKHGNEKHGQSGYRRTPTYNSWRNMLYRCNYRNHIQYNDYGGRGIKVCKRWHNFVNFLLDMGVRPEGKFIDRIDNDGNYCPANCKWSTRVEQRRNRRIDVLGRR